jgi:hypothetical protein
MKIKKFNEHVSDPYNEEDWDDKIKVYDVMDRHKKQQNFISVNTEQLDYLINKDLVFHDNEWNNWYYFDDKVDLDFQNEIEKLKIKIN